MKNIHVLPANKPSSLYSSGNNSKLLFLKGHIFYRAFGISPQNIYITSDEEIKEGVNQWYLDKVLNKPRNSSGSQYGENQNVIILTTDQDLIKDGVQAIDYEFLEWFVKNPNCEEVEIRKEYITPLGDIVETCYDNERLNYKIIIPKEEPKQICDNCKIEISKYGCACGGKPKQETLEEAIEEELSFIHNSMRSIDFDLAFKTGGVIGAKWKQERMYSEEDMKKCWQEATEDMRKQFSTSYAGMTFEKWFEKFKNK